MLRPTRWIENYKAPIHAHDSCCHMLLEAQDGGAHGEAPLLALLQEGVQAHCVVEGRQVPQHNDDMLLLRLR